MQASNYSELCAMLLPPVKKALRMVGEDYMMPVIETDINLVTGRGDFYQWGSGAGSLSQAWSVSDAGDGIEFHYDSGKLIYVSAMGKHMTPDVQNSQNAENEFVSARHFVNQEKVEDMASLIDLGLGGRLFGNGNPTQTPTHFWDMFIDDWNGNKRSWVVTGLEAVGLPVVYKGFI